MEVKNYKLTCYVTQAKLFGQVSHGHLSSSPSQAEIKGNRNIFRLYQNKFPEVKLIFT